jgi:hypothetical protein
MSESRDGLPSFPLDDEPWKPAKMVGWYDPRQLLRTGIQVVTSSLFAENADGRLTQPVQDPHPSTIDEAGDSIEGAAGAPRSSIIVDYIADTGDGFDSTYSVIREAARERLVLASTSGGEPVELPRGDVLVLGGDEVYPTASDAEYEARFTRPYAMASTHIPAEAAPSLLAIPGNHDWYDNLIGFRRLFLRQQKIGGWTSKQRRSYFVLKLPHDWWLFAPDVQLGSDIDQPQYDYLTGVVARELEPNSRVILCTAEPHWVTENESAQDHVRQPRKPKLLRELERVIDGDEGRIRALIAGDLHHYRRHTGRAGHGKRTVQLITAGGGGAFLHPTHGWRDGSDRHLAKESGIQDYRFVTAYPTVKQSRRIAWSLPIGFLFRNGWFLAASGALYAAAVLQVILSARLFCATSRHCPADGIDILAAPGIVLLVAFIVIAFVAFTDTSSNRYRWIAGGLHGLVHATAAIGIPLVSAQLLERYVLSLWMLPLMAILSVLGAATGSLIMGTYLFISLNVFGRHRNEAFSALRETSFKSFLRIKIDERGAAHVYAIGMDEVSEWGFEPQTVLTPLTTPKKPGTAPKIIDYVTL